MQERKFGALSSSVDPTKLSLSIESAGKTIIAIVAFLAAWKGIDGQQVSTILGMILQAIVTGVPAMVAVYNMLMLVWGLLRKLLVAFSSGSAN